MGDKLIAGIFLFVIGIIFLFNSSDIGEGAFKFYRMIYTKKNLRIMFKVAGIIFVAGGIIILALGWLGI